MDKIVKKVAVETQMLALTEFNFALQDSKSLAYASHKAHLSS